MLTRYLIAWVVWTPISRIPKFMSRVAEVYFQDIASLKLRLHVVAFHHKSQSAAFLSTINVDILKPDVNDVDPRGSRRIMVRLFLCLTKH